MASFARRTPRSRAANVAVRDDAQVGSAAVGIGVGLGLISPRGTVSNAAATAIPAELIDDVITAHPPGCC